MAAHLWPSYDLLGAFWLTIQLAFWSAIGSLVIGTVIAILRVSPVPVLRLTGTAYVNTFRNTPLTADGVLLRPRLSTTCESS